MWCHEFDLFLCMVMFMDHTRKGSHLSSDTSITKFNGDAFVKIQYFSSANAFCTIHNAHAAIINSSSLSASSSVIVTPQFL